MTERDWQIQSRRLEDAEISLRALAAGWRVSAQNGHDGNTWVTCWVWCAPGEDFTQWPSIPRNKYIANDYTGEGVCSCDAVREWDFQMRNIFAPKKEEIIG